MKEMKEMEDKNKEINEKMTDGQMGRWTQEWM